MPTHAQRHRNWRPRQRGRKRTQATPVVISMVAGAAHVEHVASVAACSSTERAMLSVARARCDKQRGEAVDAATAARGAATAAAMANQAATKVIVSEKKFMWFVKAMTSECHRRKAASLAAARTQ